LKRAAVTILVVVGLLFVFLMSRRTNPPGAAAPPSASHAAKVQIFDAHALGQADCGLGDPDYRTVVVTLLPEKHLRINHDESSWDEVKALLTDVFKTRTEKTLYLLNQSGSSADLERMESIVEQTGVEKICILDLSNPMKLPKPLPASGGSGVPR
jgi:hypothetical protein